MPKFHFNEDDAANEEVIDAWHDGYFATHFEKSPYQAPHLRDAWEEGRRQAADDRKVRVQLPERPEGYYHTKLSD